MERTDEIEYRYMSDEDIAQQYSGMKILDFGDIVDVNFKILEKRDEPR